MKPEKLFLNLDFLYEASSSELTEIEEKSKSYIQERILNDAKLKKVETVAFVGANGSGKSTILKDILDKLDKNKEITYVPFEIWQESNENETWKDFIITIISKTDNKNKKRIAKKVDNGCLRWWYWPIPIIIVVAASALYFFPIEFNKNFYNIGTLIFSVVGSLGIFAIFQRFFSDGSISHIFQYEDKLVEALKNEHGSPIVVLVEDVDRTESGRKVVEILHTFLNTHRKKAKRGFIVICPVPRESFYGISAKNTDEFNNLKTLESSCKIYDYAIWSGLRSQVTDSDIKTVLDSAACTNKHLYGTLCNIVHIADRKNSLLNIRALKFILREIEQFIRRYPTLDPNIAALFIATKYINLKISSPTSGRQDDLSRALREGTAILLRERREALTKLFDVAFDIGEKIKWKKIRNGIEIPISISFQYTRDDQPHEIQEQTINNKDVLVIHLSGHYKELL